MTNKILLLTDNDDDASTLQEGIETQVQLAFLQARDCAEEQGYLFGAPMTSVKFTAIFKSRIVAAIN